MSLQLDEHREYLSDRVRIGAFRRAIRETVRPGDVVVDLGAGTGILGMLACQAGAERVYSIDAGGMAQLARAVVESNRMDGRISVIKGLSTRVSLPELADVVVADQIGRFGFDAGVFEYFSDANARLLKPGARAIPSKIDLWVALVEHPVMWKRIDFWSHSPGGFEFGAARSIAGNTGYPIRLQPRDLLGEPFSAASLDTLRQGSRPISFSGELIVSRAGTLHGIGGWFSAILAPNVEMTNSPLVRQRINRRNVFFPISRPVAVLADDRVKISFAILPKDLMVKWSVEIHASSRHGVVKPIDRFSHSTFAGMLLSEEDMARTHPEFVPVISKWGKARQTILELCDGHRTLKEIELGVLRHHPDLFSSQAEAATFSAEVVTRYAL